MACAEGQSVLSPPIDAACPEGPRQGWEHIYEREGGRTGVFYMKQIFANLKQICALRRMVGGQRVSADSPTAQGRMVG